MAGPTQYLIPDLIPMTGQYQWYENFHTYAMTVITDQPCTTDLVITFTNYDNLTWNINPLTIPAGSNYAINTLSIGALGGDSIPTYFPVNPTHTGGGDEITSDPTYTLSVYDNGSDVLTVINYLGGIQLDLTQAIPLSNGVGTTGEALAAARADGIGKIAYNRTAQTFTLYASDDTTVLKTFNVTTDSNGNIIGRA